MCLGEHGDHASTETRLRFLRGDRQPRPRDLGSGDRDLFPEEALPVVSFKSSTINLHRCNDVFEPVDVSRITTEKGRAFYTAQRKKEQRERYDACIEEEKLRAEKKFVSVNCDVLLVNPCRKEFFMRCAGRNVDHLPESEPVKFPKIGRVLRVSWAQSAQKKKLRRIEQESSKSEPHGSGGLQR